MGAGEPRADDRAGRHCLVEGRVQGVFFRDSTRKQAERLGVTGWVRNLPDGRVEVKAFGPAHAVERLCGWLRDGPAQARVDGVRCEAIAYEAQPDFRIV